MPLRFIVCEVNNACDVPYNLGTKTSLIKYREYTQPFNNGRVRTASNINGNLRSIMVT